MSSPFFSTSTDRVVAVYWDWRVGLLPQRNDNTTARSPERNCLWAIAPSPFSFPCRSKAFHSPGWSLVWLKVSSVKQACCLHLCFSSTLLRDPQLHLNGFSNALTVFDYTPTDVNFGSFHRYYLLAFAFKQTSWSIFRFTERLSRNYAVSTYALPHVSTTSFITNILKWRECNGSKWQTSGDNQKSTG